MKANLPTALHDREYPLTEHVLAAAKNSSFQTANTNSWHYCVASAILVLS